MLRNYKTNLMVTKILEIMMMHIKILIALIIDDFKVYLHLENLVYNICLVSSL